jgi:hypothetical protein
VLSMFGSLGISADVNPKTQPPAQRSATACVPHDGG